MKMKQLFSVIFFIFATLSVIKAQYCPNRVGATFCYVTVDDKNNTLKDTITITNVLDKGKSLVVKWRNYGESSKEGKSVDTAEESAFVYYKERDVTEVVLLDGDEENDKVRSALYARYPPGKEAEAEAEFRAYCKVIRSEGRIAIPLSSTAKVGEEMPECRYLQKSGFFKMWAFLKKGKYEGVEKVHTPAGDFDCVKVSYQLKGKIMLFSMSEYCVDWYALGIGMVKSQETDKRGRVKTTTLLHQIK